MASLKNIAEGAALSPTGRADYAEASRETLIARIQSLEAALAAKSGAAEPPAVAEGRSKRSRLARPFPFEAYPRAHIALRVSYFGWSYNGFASQMSYKDNSAAREADMSGDGAAEADSTAAAVATEGAGAAPRKGASATQLPPRKPVVTVEDLLFDAMLRTRLVESPRTCNYSRCGRTDAGVSSTGQVIGITVRSSHRRIGAPPKETAAEGDGGEDRRGATTLGEEAEDGGEEGQEPFDIPICTMLNNLLPADIRVTGWSHVPADFNARFACIGRKYRYFFSSTSLDIGAMRDAAERLVGTHDFRNFARRDPSKKVDKFVRTIFSCQITPVTWGGEPSEPNGSYPSQMFACDIHGSAFLYHQVRCTMAILFLVGRHIEPPSVVDYMLDIGRCPEVPRYDFASDVPLVLYECCYPESFKMHFRISKKEEEKAMLRTSAIYQEQLIKGLTAGILLNSSVLPLEANPLATYPSHSRIYKE